MADLYPWEQRLEDERYSHPDLDGMHEVVPFALAIECAAEAYAAGLAITMDAKKARPR